MKKQSIFLAITLALAVMTTSASASMSASELANLQADYDFVDLIDYWYVAQDAQWFDAVLIDEYFLGPVDYTHDITDDGVPDQYFVTDAWLELDFTNEENPPFGGDPDGHGRVLGIRYDRREYVEIAYDGVQQAWTDITDWTDEEIDAIPYEFTVGINWLTDGYLDVQIDVFNQLGTGDISLDYSVLYGNLQAVPVPGAVLLGILGLGAAGARLRKRS